MEFDRETLLKLGKLARISIKDKQLDFLSRDLSSILKFVDQLKEINTENIDPTANSLNQNLIRREDEKSNTNNIEDVLENAPEKELNFYVVPKVIEQMIDKLNIVKAAELLKKKEVSSVQIVKEYLNRINKGKDLNCFNEVSSTNAVKDAEASDERRKNDS